MSRSNQPRPPWLLNKPSFPNSKNKELMYPGGSSSSSLRFMDPDVSEVPPSVTHNQSNLIKEKGKEPRFLAIPSCYELCYCAVAADGLKLVEFTEAGIMHFMVAEPRFLAIPSCYELCYCAVAADRLKLVEFTEAGMYGLKLVEFTEAGIMHFMVAEVSCYTILPDGLKLVEFTEAGMFFDFAALYILRGFFPQTSQLSWLFAREGSTDTSSSFLWLLNVEKILTGALPENITVNFLDVIDINEDANSVDSVLIGEKAGSNKGKTIEGVHDSYGDHQVKGMFNEMFHSPVMEISEPGSGVDSSNGYTSAAHNFFSADGHGSDQSTEDDDDYSYLFLDNDMDEDNFALLQSHFDIAETPPGIEAPIPWLAGHDLGSKKTESSSLFPSGHIQSDAKNYHITNVPQTPWLLGPPYHVTQGTSLDSSSSQINMKPIGHSSALEFFPPKLFSDAASSKKKSDASQSRKHKSKLGLSWIPSKSHLRSGPSESKKKHTVLEALANSELVPNSESLQPHGGVPPYWGHFPSGMQVLGSSSPYYVVGPENGSLLAPGIEVTNPLWLNNPPYLMPFSNFIANFGFTHLAPTPPEQLFDDSWVHNSAGDGNNGSITDNTVGTISDEAREEILRKFRNFKQFDTVEDTSDHHYRHVDSSIMQHSKSWSKRIQEEWRSLEKDLPDSIFVRVYESRIDLLRAVIIGAEGTPYHDGLFSFDVSFPSGYPEVPPLVHYNSGGLRLNPNLYNTGKVCLSLLNTWSGNEIEMWIPGVSTILQVLVSIQGLILNAKPYFNEPGYAHLSGSADGETQSLRYNEDTFILSLKTMVYMMRRPPKNFEDFVTGHFFSRAHDILVSCKAYMDGAQVGCLVKGGVQDVDQGDGSSSLLFKSSLGAYANMLARELTKIGAKDCDKFLTPTTSVNKPRTVREMLDSVATFP
ncbi:hypothetical protein RIF29_31012 [Crotalaria pallida]|uniref:E2 ubiquitin-conjugating enzyme n=1 Tax=Crotalaria pallida TaxID=3830 RepID=A0AAN9ENR2_CROPI